MTIISRTLTFGLGMDKGDRGFVFLWSLNTGSGPTEIQYTDNVEDAYTTEYPKHITDVLDKIKLLDPSVVLQPIMFESVRRFECMTEQEFEELSLEHRQKRALEKLDDQDIEALGLGHLKKGD